MAVYPLRLYRKHYNGFEERAQQIYKKLRNYLRQLFKIML